MCKLKICFIVILLKSVELSVKQHLVCEVLFVCLFVFCLKLFHAFCLMNSVLRFTLNTFLTLPVPNFYVCVTITLSLILWFTKFNTMLIFFNWKGNYTTHVHKLCRTRHRKTPRWVSKRHSSKNPKLIQTFLHPVLKFY